MKTNVYFTVDTEATLGGALSNPELFPPPVEQRVFCNIGGRPFGVPLILKTAVRRGHRQAGQDFQ